MLGGKGIKSVYRIPEGTCIANVFPSKCCQARCISLVSSSSYLEFADYALPAEVAQIISRILWDFFLALTTERRNWSVDGLHQHAFPVELADASQQSGLNSAE